MSIVNVSVEKEILIELSVSALVDDELVIRNSAACDVEEESDESVLTSFEGIELCAP